MTHLLQGKVARHAQKDEAKSRKTDSKVWKTDSSTKLIREMALQIERKGKHRGLGKI